MFAVLGVASNRASKAPVGGARALFCHAPALVTQLGAVTVIAAVPLWPSLVAVIVAVPPATPVASPLPLTVAAAVLLLAHVTVRPVSVFPAASLVTAASCAVPPTERVADAGLTVTNTTGASGGARGAGAKNAASLMLFQFLLLFPGPTLRT